MDSHPIVAVRVLGEDHRVVVVITRGVLVAREQRQQKASDQESSSESEKLPFSHFESPSLSAYPPTLPRPFCVAEAATPSYEARKPWPISARCRNAREA